MKWMDQPSVTEMERGGVYEMDGQKSAKKIKIALESIKLHILVTV